MAAHALVCTRRGFVCMAVQLRAGQPWYTNTGCYPWQRFSMLLPCVLGVWCVFRGKGLVARSVLVCCLWQCAVIMLLTMGSTQYHTDMGDFFDYRIRIEPRFASAEFVAQLARGIMLTISLVFMLYIIFSKRVGTIYNRRGQKL